MKAIRLTALALLVAFLTGCATSGTNPYYYGGTSYRMQNIGGLPVSGSVGVSATSGGIMFSPNIVISPTYKDWRKK